MQEHLFWQHSLIVEMKEVTAEPLPNPRPLPEREGEQDDVFEVELREVSSTVDEQGVEHKTFTVKGE